MTIRHQKAFAAAQQSSWDVFLVFETVEKRVLGCRQAQTIFEKLLKKATNHLNLLSEDIMEDGSQWGNFPQTYSHVGLMNAAFRIARKLDRPIFF